MKITMTSDLHGHFPETLGGDLLIVGGDLTARHTENEFREFYAWLNIQQYEEKILIGGNHDNFFVNRPDWWYEAVEDAGEFTYLCDSGTEFEGLKIWGVPYSLWFPRINPKCAAFTGDEKYLKSKYDLIPNDIDILISHGPAYGILDESAYDQQHCGSVALREAVERIKPKILICGHIHEGYGHYLLNHGDTNTDCYNVSHMDVHYRPINPIVNIEI